MLKKEREGGTKEKEENIKFGNTNNLYKNYLRKSR